MDYLVRVLLMALAMVQGAAVRGFAPVSRARSCATARLLASARMAASPAGLGAFLEMPEGLSAALRARGINSPTPIQVAAFERVRAGESVVLHAETGSGKSLAFLLPILLRLAPGEKVLVVAPTRELAVQLSAEAASICGELGGSVELAIVGTAPSVDAIAGACVLVGTPAELEFALCRSDYAPQLTAKFVGAIKAVVLDEVDKLLPISQTFGPQAAKMKRQSNRAKEHVSPTETLLLALLERTSTPQMQLVAASATASKTTRAKLHRVLRRDQFGRW
ncbi:P-loop containing nucleoside triphosphate hydrolase protein [Pavlovales sp. CCMP2436]|nr:P-loop containing nucleoside triphosphate hydrolase protein [Pavlovales sp. CCMP2436]